MNHNIRIKVDSKRLFDYISDFEKGNLQIPAFSRDFVWTNEKKLALFDSVKKGYPIGSILLWQPDFEKEEDYEKLGTEKLGAYNMPKRNYNSFYVLDGVQRLSTLIGCLIHPEKAKQKGIIRDEKEWEKEWKIVYNLKNGLFEINRSKGFDNLAFYQIPVYRLIDGKEFFSFQKQLSLFEENENAIEKYINKYEEISLIFQNYEIPNTQIYKASFSEILDIFQRLNSTGAPITADWVVSARAFGKDKSFRLGTEIDKLLENDLKQFNFQSLKRDVILKCITNSFGDIYFDQIANNNTRKLENLVDRDDFIPTTQKTFIAIQKATKFLFEELLVLDSKLLPYNNQLIFMTDFFNQVENPSKKQLKTLKKWFWISTYANYFTIYNLSKQHLAYQQFQEFMLDEDTDPVFYDTTEPFSTLEFPAKIEMGSVRKKALALFMLNYSVRGENILNSPSVKAEDIEGCKEYKLFKEEQMAENAIFIMEKFNVTDNFPKTLKDLSFMLSTENKNKYENLFISEEMREAYKIKDFEKVLAIRKTLIICAEKTFVESLDLIYTP